MHGNEVGVRAPFVAQRFVSATVTPSPTQSGEPHAKFSFCPAICLVKPKFELRVSPPTVASKLRNQLFFLPRNLFGQG
jgi:hypothetical protein